MTEKDFQTEEATENVSTYWDDACSLLNDDDFRLVNRGMTYLLCRMSSKLLEEKPEIYNEGLNLTLDKLEHDNYTVRYCAVSVLANVLEQTENSIEHQEIFNRVGLAIKKSTHDPKKTVRVTAKAVNWKYLKGKKLPKKI